MCRVRGGPDRQRLARLTVCCFSLSVRVQPDSEPGLRPGRRGGPRGRAGEEHPRHPGYGEPSREILITHCGVLFQARTILSSPSRPTRALSAMARLRATTLTLKPTVSPSICASTSGRETSPSTASSALTVRTFRTWRVLFVNRVDIYRNSVQPAVFYL